MSDVFEFPVTVRYLEVDQQGVVFNAWYLAWFDEAMTAFVAARGMPYDDLVALGCDVQLVHTELDWHDAVRWNDPVVVAVSTARLGTTSFTLDFQVRRGGDVVVDGRTVYVVVDVDGGGTWALPDEVRAALEPVAPLRPV
jgi:acyl-CoA thioester hydrolase